MQMEDLQVMFALHL